MNLTQMQATFVLLVVFQLKHFLADFPLQGKYMLGKFKGGWDWVVPLAAHCSVHSFFTCLILWTFNRLDALWYLSYVDFAVHFAQDRIKASPNLLGRWKPDNKYFWWALGQDQAVHHLTHYFIIAKMVGFL